MPPRRVRPWSFDDRVQLLRVTMQQHGAGRTWPTAEADLHRIADAFMLVSKTYVGSRRGVLRVLHNLRVKYVPSTEDEVDTQVVNYLNRRRARCT